jgi:hypothetical protein
LILQTHHSKTRAVRGTAIGAMTTVASHTLSTAPWAFGQWQTTSIHRLAAQLAASKVCVCLFWKGPHIEQSRNVRKLDYEMACGHTWHLYSSVSSIPQSQPEVEAVEQCELHQLTHAHTPVRTTHALHLLHTLVTLQPLRFRQEWVVPAAAGGCPWPWSVPFERWAHKAHNLKSVQPARPTPQHPNLGTAKAE